VHSTFSVKKSPGADVTCSLPRHWSTSKEPNLVISFPGPKHPSQNSSANSVEAVNGMEEKDLSVEEASFSDQPVFFR
jgi:autophagy-related protein 2